MPVYHLEGSVIRLGNDRRGSASSRVRAIERPDRDLLGEGPMWSSRHRALFWVDIFGCAINRWNFDTGEIARYSVGERIGWILERRDHASFLVGLKSGVASLSFEPFDVQFLFAPEPDRPANRLNDAKVDREGRLWMGTKDDMDSAATGALYRVSSDLSCIRCDDGYVVTNGPTFSPDGRTLYHADSGRQVVYAFDLSTSGDLMNRREFVRFEAEWGYPDGMTTDAEGGVWIAHWGGGRISRFHSDGKLDYSIPIPARNVTSLVFAGPQLNRLFVTTSSFVEDHDDFAGCLFEVETEEHGIASQLFAG